MGVFSTEAKEKFIVLRRRGMSLEEISEVIEEEPEELEKWDAALLQEPEINVCRELERERLRKNI